MDITWLYAYVPHTLSVIRNWCKFTEAFFLRHHFISWLKQLYVVYICNPWSKVRVSEFLPTVFVLIMFSPIHSCWVSFTEAERKSLMSDYSFCLEQRQTPLLPSPPPLLLATDDILPSCYVKVSARTIGPHSLPKEWGRPIFQTEKNKNKKQLMNEALCCLCHVHISVARATPPTECLLFHCRCWRFHPFLHVFVGWIVSRDYEWLCIVHVQRWMWYTCM